MEDTINQEEDNKVCECQTPKQSLFPDGKYYCLVCWNEWYH